MKKINKTKIALGTSLMAGLVTGCATGDKAFEQKELSSGYMNKADSAKHEMTGKVKDGACGEGKCGGSMVPAEVEETTKTPEGKCGEGKCGADHH